MVRAKELENWAADFNLPATIWLAGFFNPQSFLTAIMQQTARKNEWPLDKMCLNCELFPQMPVIYIKAVTQDKQDVKNIYECPLYKTRARGATYVWTFNLKTKEKAAKWTLGGVALLLQN